MMPTPRNHIIPFNKPTCLGTELDFIQDCIHGNRLCGDNSYTRQCSALLEERFKSARALLTTSCTAALEMAALLVDIGPGDEVICPSFTFVTTASAFALRGAKIVFVDIRRDTLNMDEKAIENAVTDKTKAIVVVHYAGVACEMDSILSLAEKYGLAVIEDAAQAIGSTYKDRLCGSMGNLGCFSFHETKNIVCGEGGALMVNEARLVERAEIIREKGTDRTKFHRGEVDKYTWIDLGSSYLPSDIVAAYLLPQLREMEKINSRRMTVWNMYHGAFESFEAKGLVRRPVIPSECQANGHMYYLLFPEKELRSRYIHWMKEKGILTVFHYLPLHSAPAGKLYGRSEGELPVTVQVSERLVRLPLFYAILDEDAERVIAETACFLESL